jgi:ATP-dependent exoDNAse (exonuclease V) alpha subunit
LLAPTGRAAKVIANYSNKPAFTIHKKSISQRNLLAVEFLLLCNKININTIFIIDEASMISDTNSD